MNQQIFALAVDDSANVFVGVSSPGYNGVMQYDSSGIYKSFYPSRYFPGDIAIARNKIWYGNSHGYRSTDGYLITWDWYTECLNDHGISTGKDNKMFMSGWDMSTMRNEVWEYEVYGDPTRLNEWTCPTEGPSNGIAFDGVKYIYIGGERNGDHKICRIDIETDSFHVCQDTTIGYSPMEFDITQDGVMYAVMVSDYGGVTLPCRIERYTTGDDLKRLDIWKEFPVGTYEAYIAVHPRPVSGGMVPAKLNLANINADKQSISDGIIFSDIYPARLTLEQNYPNPVQNRTLIKYGIPGECKAFELSIYNINGQRVKSIKLNSSPGWHDVVWDGTNDLGLRVACGVYVYELGDPSIKIRKKLLVIK